VVEEDSTAVGAADFMAAAVGFTAEEDSPAEATLDLVEAIRLAGIVAAGPTEVTDITAEAAITVAAVMDGEAGATAGAAEVGEEAMAMATAGDLAMAGRIGDMAGDIRMATTATIRGITRHTLIPIRPTVTRRTL
jgi:hypothetical protein